MTYTDPRELLVYKATGKPVKIGDTVTLSSGEVVTVFYFHPPHKPSSSGHVTVKFPANGDCMEYYTSAIGAQWIVD
jgi:hypothetical protein